MDNVIKTTQKPLQLWLEKIFRTINSHIKVIRLEVFVTYLLFFILSLVLVSIYNKSDLHLTLNKYHTGFFDWFFKYSTHLGDGAMFGVLVVIFFFINKRMSLVFGIG